ncbi:MAG: zinc ABC transporter substrate-binding protein [Gammaproteobacteria bacterium]|nr:zinc ABC transporter substrate-binding protein [Gammaproteobacteria bacterium]
MLRRAAAIGALALIAVLAGGRGAAARGVEAPIPVVVSFSVLADWVRAIGAERVAVTTLVGPGGDVHVFEPAPRDVQAVQRARLMFVNGYGLEGWLIRLIEASRTKAELVELAQGANLMPLSLTGTHGVASAHHEQHAASGHGSTAGSSKAGSALVEPADPHAWQDVANARVYVGNVTRSLCAIDTEGCPDYERRQAAYLAELSDLDDWIRASIARIPKSRRTVISAHAAFGYYSRAYGVQFLAPLGISSDSDASAADVARLIRRVRGLGASAMFVETLSDTRLLEQVSRETGMRLAGKLYADTLSGADGPAASYLQMMRYNTQSIVSAVLGRP